MPAVLIGVNIGPDLMYAGSPATRLRHGERVGADVVTLRDFTRLGLLTTVPALAAAAATALWATLRPIGA